MKRLMRYADDDTYSIPRLAAMRIPSLAVGLITGVLLSFATSQFEEVLRHDVRIAFFIPFIVYMADAVGTQTQSIYTRDLRTGKASFLHYLWKESVLGVLFGALSGGVTALITYVWFSSADTTLAVSLSMFIAVSFSPLVALLVTEALELEHTDPAVGAGPIATVLQDTLSVVIFGLVASSVLL